MSITTPNQSLILITEPQVPQLADTDQTQRVSEHAVFDPIERAMREVTGDQNLRFHHLRHSAVNANLLAMHEDMIADAINLVGTAEQLKPKSLRCALLGAAEPIRPRLWVVAGLAGHASLETTLGSYFHCCDWLLYQYARQRVELDDALIAGLSNITLKNLRVIRHRYGEDAVALPALMNRQYPNSVSSPPDGYEYSPLSSTFTVSSDLDAQSKLHRMGSAWLIRVINEVADQIWPRAKLKPLTRLINKKPIIRSAGKSRTREWIESPVCIAMVAPFAMKYDIEVNQLLQLMLRTQALRHVGGQSSAAHLTAQSIPIEELVFGGVRIDRRISIPLQLRRREDELFAADFDRLFATIKAEDSELLDRFLTVFWRCYHPHSGLLKMGHFDDAFTLHQVLSRLPNLDSRNIGFLAEEQYGAQITYSFRPAPNSPRGDANQQHQYWSDLLEIERDLIKIAETPMAKTRANKLRGEFQIQLLTSQNISTGGIAKRKENHAESRSRQGAVSLVVACFACSISPLLVINTLHLPVT